MPTKNSDKVKTLLILSYLVGTVIVINRFIFG